MVFVLHPLVLSIH